MNTVGPFHNSVETYDYYKLPFCKPQSQKKDVQFGDTLSGDRRSESLYDIRFTGTLRCTDACVCVLSGLLSVIKRVLLSNTCPVTFIQLNSIGVSFAPN